MSVGWSKDYEPEYEPDDGHVYISVMELAARTSSPRLASTRVNAPCDNAPLLMFPSRRAAPCEAFDETDSRALLAHGVQSIERAARQIEAEREPYDMREFMNRLESARRRLRRSQKRARLEGAMEEMKRVFSASTRDRRPNLRKI